MKDIDQVGGDVLDNQPVGLLINFGAATLKKGVKRIVNGYFPSASPRLRASA